MNIFVTGGLGFIGSHFCEKALQNGDNVIALDNLDPYYNPKYKENNLKILSSYDSFIFINGDYNDYNLLKLLFTNYEVDVIVHIGGRAGIRTSINLAQEYARNNVVGTVNLLEAARQFNISEFIFASSSSVYGDSKEIPFTEDSDVSKPISPYAASKHSCELFGHSYYSLYKLNFLSFRFFTVYGPRGRPDMAIFKFTKKILEEKSVPVYGDGTTQRDYTYVSDIIDGIYSGLNKKLGFQIFNLGNENPISINKLIKKLEKEICMNAKVEYLPEQLGDVKVTYADISKAKKMLDFSPKISIDEGLKKFIKWFKDNKKWL